MRACILIHAKKGAADAVTKEMTAVPGVTHAFPVFGSADVVARAEVKDLRALRKLVDVAAALPGVAGTETLPELMPGGA